MTIARTCTRLRNLAAHPIADVRVGLILTSLRASRRKQQLAFHLKCPKKWSNEGWQGLKVTTPRQKKMMSIRNLSQKWTIILLTPSNVPGTWFASAPSRKLRPYDLTQAPPSAPQNSKATCCTNSVSSRPDSTTPRKTEVIFIPHQVFVTSIIDRALKNGLRSPSPQIFNHTQTSSPQATTTGPLNPK